jgi:hypothetical protein
MRGRPGLSHHLWVAAASAASLFRPVSVHHRFAPLRRPPPSHCCPLRSAPWARLWSDGDLPRAGRSVRPSGSRQRRWVWAAAQP